MDNFGILREAVLAPDLFGHSATLETPSGEAALAAALIMSWKFSLQTPQLPEIPVFRIVKR